MEAEKIATNVISVYGHLTGAHIHDLREMLAETNPLADIFDYTVYGTYRAKRIWDAVLKRYEMQTSELLSFVVAPLPSDDLLLFLNGDDPLINHETRHGLLRRFSTTLSNYRDAV